MPGLGIANNLLADRVQYNLDKNQSALKNAVSQLSSGLRINSAADDPSGLAIATNLQTRVDALHTASQNVQDANNAAQVADGALAAETDILQRIRNLAVEASNSINSARDTANLQAEVSQLLLEVNRISQSVNFNGTPLLDGSHAGFQPYVDASYTITNNAVLASAGGGGVPSTGSGIVDGNLSNPPLAPNSSTGAFPTGWTVAGPASLYSGNVGPVALGPGQQAEDLGPTALIEQTVTGLTPGGTYRIGYSAATPTSTSIEVDVNGAAVASQAISSSSLAPYTATFVADATGSALIAFKNSGAADIAFTGVTLTGVSGGSGAGGASSSAAGNLVAGVTQVTTTAPGFITSGSTVFNTTSNGAVDGTIELQVVNTSSTSVGVEVQFFSSASGASGAPVIYAANAAANTLVSVDGLNITIGNVTLPDAGTTAYIKVSQATAATSSPAGPLTVQSGAAEGDTVQVGIQATNAQTLRISNINLANTSATVLAAEDTIGQIDNALQTLLGQRAQLGAVIVRLNEDANNNGIASVNLQASESAIRDLNVGEATTEFTKLQVLVQVGTSVLAQSNSNAQSVLGLFR